MFVETLLGNVFVGLLKYDDNIRLVKLFGFAMV